MNRVLRIVVLDLAQRCDVADHLLKHSLEKGFRQVVITQFIVGDGFGVPASDVFSIWFVPCGIKNIRGEELQKVIGRNDANGGVGAVLDKVKRTDRASWL